MKSAEIVRKLESEGWRKVHQAGSHIKFMHPEKQGAVTIPHPRKDLPIGTLPVSIGRPGGNGGEYALSSLCSGWGQEARARD